MIKKKITKVLKYTAVFEPAKEGGYVVTVPALPGCISEGDTFEESIEMIKDAIEGYLYVLKHEGHDIPKETDEVIVTKVSVPEPVVLL